MSTRHPRPNRPQPGNIHYAGIDFDDIPATKYRPVLVLSATAEGIIVRPFYTKPRPGFRAVAASGYNGLDHRSFLSNRPRRIQFTRLGHQIGVLEDRLDPYGDFGDQ